MSTFVKSCVTLHKQRPVQHAPGCVCVGRRRDIIQQFYEVNIDNGGKQGDRLCRAVKFTFIFSARFVKA